MKRIKTVKKEEARGIIKEGYDMFLEHMGTVPKPMEMMSASPALFELGLKRIQYYSGHPNLSFILLAHIRYLVAHHLSYKFCMDFNRTVLERSGLEPKDFIRMEKDPIDSQLEEKEKLMLNFVVKAVKDPLSVTDDDVLKLKNAGWTDMDIVDALFHGTGMIDHSIMMAAFSMGTNCIV